MPTTVTIHGKRARAEVGSQVLSQIGALSSCRQRSVQIDADLEPLTTAASEEERATIRGLLDASRYTATPA